MRRPVVTEIPQHRVPVVRRHASPVTSHTRPVRHTYVVPVVREIALRPAVSAGSAW